MSDDDDDWELAPGAQRAANIGDYLLVGGGFALLLCGGPLIGFPLLFAAAAVKIVGPMTRRSGPPIDLWGPLGCGLVASVPGFALALALLAAIMWFLHR